MKKIIKNNKLISIVIVNYNGKKWLKKCLDSLFNQTYENFEIIFVDNASVDDSLEFIRNNYNDSRIKIIKSDKNLGFAGGNNLGVGNSLGSYIMLLNNDTWLENKTLEQIFSFYEKNDFHVVAPYIRDYEKKKVVRPYLWKIDLLGHPIRIEKKESSHSFYLGGACIFFKKELYIETLGLDDNFFMYSEEVDWFWRLNLLKCKSCYIDDIYVYHAGGGSSGDGIRYLSFLWRNQNILQMLLKNYRWFNLLWVLPIYFVQNIFEIIFFILILRPKIAHSYVQGWGFNIVNFRKIMHNRKWVQENRMVGDFEIIKMMYIGFAKIHHLINFYKINVLK
ncbi:MAG: glycosyltransferase family 2 protein [Parcubacteria group bacterium]|jgi:hypothetical protein